MKISGMVKSCLKIYSACNSSVPLQLRAKIYSGPAVRWIIDTAGTQKEEKVMKETWNVLDPDEYVKHNPFMGYTNMKIEKISRNAVRSV